MNPKPCKTCPFRPDITPGELGGGNPLTFVGQANGPFYLPCHAQPEYDPKGKDHADIGKVQCAGAAVFRANCGVTVPDGLLQAEPGPEAFGSFVEFIAHHTQRDAAEIAALLERFPPDLLTAVEQRQAAVRPIHIPK